MDLETLLIVIQAIFLAIIGYNCVIINTLKKEEILHLNDIIKYKKEAKETLEHDSKILREVYERYTAYMENEMEKTNQIQVESNMPRMSRFKTTPGKKIGG